MAILDFMPKFAPWYTKQILKKEDEPAKEPSTGFFGDVFNYIAEDFGWEPRPEPVEPDWGGAQIGAGFGEAAPAYEPYIEPDYSGMGDPFGMNDPFTEEEWVSAPSTPSPFSGPILGGMFGSAPPTPAPGFGETIGGSLGSGEGWGFDLVDEPTQSWAGYAPPPSPSPWGGGITGGMFAPPPELPTSYPDISAQWNETDWVSPPPRESFGENFGSSFRERLGTATAGRDPWADVLSAPPAAAPEPQFAMDQLAGVPGNGFGAAIGDAFSGFGADLGARIAEPREFEPLPPIEPTWMGAERGAEIGANAPFADRTQMRDIGYYPTGWEQMSPKERGEYVYFSGLRGDDYLSENDYANMPVDLKQKIGYTDSRIEGGIGNGFASIWDKIDTAFTQPLQLTGDLAYDPIKSMAQDVNPLDLPGLLSASPTSYANVIGDVWGDRQNIEVPLDETVANVQESSNPFEFFDKQGEDFKDRPFLEQLLLGVITPGSGIYKNIPAMPRALTSFDSAVDLVQGGALLDNIGTIPGASTALKNVIIPGGAGFAGGVATDAIFDPTFPDQFGDEYDPSWWEMGLAGSLGVIGAKQAIRNKTVPFGAGLDDASKNLPLSGVRFRAAALDDIEVTPSATKWTATLEGTKKRAKLEWDDPLDKAFYEATSGNKSGDPAFIALRAKGFEEGDILEAGYMIRDHIGRASRGLTGGETIRVPRIIRQSAATDALSAVPPSVANPVDEILESSTVPPTKNLTASQRKLPITEQRAILGGLPAPNQKGYLTWIDENNRINSMEAKTPEWRARNLETVNPTNDPVVGKDINGLDVHERVRDGLRYTIRDGRVRTGVSMAEDEISTVPPSANSTLGELQEEVRLSDPEAAAAMFSPGAVTPSPSIADGIVDAPVTPPVATGSPVVADGVVDISTPKPVISRPVPADLSPAARNAVEQIDAKLDNLIGVDSKLRREEFNLRQSQIAEDARRVARDQGLDEYQILQAGNAASKGFSIDDLVPIANDPGALRLTAEEMKEVATVINARTKSQQIKNAAGRILKEWANGEKVNKYDLDTLRTAITGTWNPKGPRTINSIVPPSTVMADGAVDAIPPATTLPVPKGVDIEKPVPGMKQPISKTLDEIPDLPLTPAEKNTIGADDDFFMDEPIDVEEDEWVDINDWWRDEDVITPGAQAGPPKPRREPLWKKAMADAQQPADDQVIDFTTPAAADDVIDFTSQTAKKTNPVIQEVDAWEKQMLARGQGADPEKFQKELDRSMTELVARLGPDSVKPAQFSRDRIPGRIARLAEIEKADRLALASNEAIAEWRRVNLDELKDIPIDAKSSWGERYVGGALKNKLADQLTLRGRELSEYLQKQGYTFEESKAIVNAELARYLDDRVLREAGNGNSAAILDRALTALHMGDFQPDMKGVTVPKGTGDVAKFVDIGRTANSTLKNMSFGIADAGALMANAIPAVQAQPHTILLGYLNRILNMVDLGVNLDEAKRLRELSGLATGSSQDVIDEKVGTLVGIGGRYLQGTGATKAGDVLVEIDQVPVAFNRVLEKAQFDLVLDKSLRQPIYEGNLVLMKLLGRDINTNDARRAAARIANAVTSTAPLARGNTRRGIEGASLGSARFLRAQVDLILAASKIINPKATAEERIVAATTIAGMIGTFVLAKAVHGESMEADWDNPYSFGQILLPGGVIMPSLQQRQLAMAFNKSTQELAKVIYDDKDADISKVFDPWIQFTISRAGPLAQYPMKLAGIGYDPKEDRYSYPGKGRTPFGASMDKSERFEAALPIPVGVSAWRDNEGPLWSKIANVAGAGTRPEDAFAAALRKEGVDSLDEMKEAWNQEDPSTTAAKLAKFYKDNPSLFDEDTALADNQVARKENSEKFMDSNYKFLVGDWREEKKRLSDRMGGIYDEMGIEEKERPEEDGSLQWVYDYNELFKKALVDTDNTAKGMDMEKLGDLQAEFWTEHSDPEVRKAIISYQLEKADTEADKLWIKSMARLNGFDPNTGKPLTTPSGKKNLPNYFEMERYRYKEINNDDAQDVLARFEQWRNSLPERYVESEKREDLLRQFILEKDELSYRPDSKPWTPTAINDVMTYGRDSAETAEYTAYKKTMRPELLWFEDDSSWERILEAHEKAGRK